MSASYKITNETYFPSVETLDIEHTLKSTAALDIDILLLGETGTVKDTLAQRIHRLSGR